MTVNKLKDVLRLVQEASALEHDGLKLNRVAAARSIDGLVSRTRRIIEPGPKLRKQPHAK
jgi:hypothetical protein